MCLHPQPTSGAGTDFPAGQRGPLVSARGQDFTWHLGNQQPSCCERPPRQAEPSAHTHGLVGPQEGNPRPREGRPVAQGHTAGTSRAASEFQQSVCQGNPPGPCTPCGAGSSGQVGGPSPGSCAHTLSPSQASGERASTPRSAPTCSPSSRGRRTASCRSSSRASRARFGRGAPTWTWATGRACCSSCVPTWRVPGEWVCALVTQPGTVLCTPHPSQDLAQGTGAISTGSNGRDWL